MSCSWTSETRGDGAGITRITYYGDTASELRLRALGMTSREPE